MKHRISWSCRKLDAGYFIVAEANVRGKPVRIGVAISNEAWKHAAFPIVLLEAASKQVDYLLAQHIASLPTLH